MSDGKANIVWTTSRAARSPLVVMAAAPVTGRTALLMECFMLHHTTNILRPEKCKLEPLSSPLLHPKKVYCGLQRVGEVGCCDPAVMAAWFTTPPRGKETNVVRKPNSVRHKKHATSQSTGPLDPTQKELAADKVAHMLILVTNPNRTRPNWTIDLTSGNITQKLPVKGYNTHGEATRDFLYDPKANLFYQFDVDFQAANPPSGRPIVLSKVNL